MKRWLLILISATVLASTARAQGPADADAAGYKAHAETGIMVAMRDGVRLTTDLYFPEGARGKLPVVLWRSIYGKEGAFERERLL
jgi:uncharacterized protein